MPRPVSAQATYLPGLDGVRALAVIAVFAYHLDVPFLPGGLLGVGMFFTLSGFLITSILLRSWDERGDLELRTFWLRRARRLLPAVILLLVTVLAATALVAPDDLSSRFGESIAAMFYVSNWTTIASDTSYFDAFADPGPLDHLWSLAIEEQFYLVWPLLLFGLLTLFGRRPGRLAFVTLGLAAASFAWMQVVAQQGFDNTRAYEGTDTRAGALLMGAALAMVYRPERLSPHVARGAKTIIDGLGVAALVVIGWLMVVTDPFSLSLYRGGLLILSIATALLVAVVVHPASSLAVALGTAPLVWIGARSYGIYLWHLPVIAFTPDTVLTDQPVVRGAIQVAVTVGLAALSWTFVEDPIRRHGLIGAVRPVSGFGTAPLGRLGTGGSSGLGAPLGSASMGALSTGLGGRRSRSTAPAVAGGTALVAGVGILALALPPVIGGTARSTASADESVATEGEVATEDAGDEPAFEPAYEVASDGSTAGGPNGSAPGRRGRAGRAAEASGSAPANPETSCDGVVHIGDSTSRGLFNPDWLTDPATRMDARYQAVGVVEVHEEVSPAQSVVETYGDDPNAETRVANYIADGYDGCWVFALGMQDAANQSVGGVVPLGERIDLLMGQIGDAPALWMTGLALEQDGPWSDPEIRKWNDAVVEACARWPNMRVYDWRSEAQEEWYDSDGIHFNPTGDVERANRIATALAVAFPAGSASPPDCVVRTA